jgi:hypothetical protein
MALDIEGFTRWLEGKRADVAAEEPLSIQANIAALSQRLWKAEQTLEQVRRFIDTAGFPDDTEVRYAQGYNDARNDVARILGGDA